MAVGESHITRVTIGAGIDFSIVNRHLLEDGGMNAIDSTYTGCTQGTAEYFVDGDYAASYENARTANAFAGELAGSNRSDLGSFAMSAAAEILSADVQQELTTFYAQNYHALVRLTCMLVRSVPIAEELVQDVFTCMAAGQVKLRDPDKILAYARQAVVNRARSALRRQTVEARHKHMLLPDMESAEGGAIDHMEQSEVVVAVRNLPDRQREAIVLRYYVDMNEAQIAAAMGISRGAVKSHTARGMDALRTAFGV